MVLVSVGDDDAAELVLPLDDVAVVGKDQVDARMVFVGEHEPRVYDDHVRPELEHGHVLPDLVEPAEWDDAQNVLPMAGHVSWVRAPFGGR